VLRALQRGSVRADRRARGRPVEKARELVEVDAGQRLAAGNGFVAHAAPHVRLDAAVLPVPDLANAELAVHVELVDAARRENHLDHEIGTAFALRLRPEDVALVRLGAALVAPVLQRPGTVRGELDAALLASRRAGRYI
jgi:hypothetical protein